jgi:hypothetical protein
MRRVQHLLQLVAGLNDVGFRRIVSTENMMQFRIPPVRDVNVLRVIAGPFTAVACVVGIGFRNESVEI